MHFSPCQCTSSRIFGLLRAKKVFPYYAFAELTCFWLSTDEITCSSICSNELQTQSNRVVE